MHLGSGKDLRRTERRIHEVLHGLPDGRFESVKGKDGTFRFVYVSGMGTATDGNGAMWARVKVNLSHKLIM